ncbi:hypothetical protein FCM35_KLT11607 [Carex littledalei]|uniref:Uncharacterized protein n=1 Tax=Carex littledalei TaxID=544730 RepID=A0A833QGQ6_9POAL|nr:hypothetical protein FCM35_KLT11607 [Carex littledalei]
MKGTGGKPQFGKSRSMKFPVMAPQVTEMEIYGKVVTSSITRTVSKQKGDESSNQYRYKTVMSRNVKDLLVQVQTGTVEEEEEEEEEEESQEMEKEEVQVLLLGSGHDAVED